MNGTTIDELNKILTNTLQYQDLYQKIAKSVSHEQTVKKLREFAGIAENESERLIKVISNEGGKVQTTPRHTDQAAVCWTPQQLPDMEEMQPILNCLIAVEREKLNDYTKICNSNGMDNTSKDTLETHLQQAESNLQYLEVAIDTYEKN